MIPLRDTVPTRTTPFITYALLVANTLVFILQLVSPDGGEKLIFEYGVIPARTIGWIAGDPVSLKEAVFPLAASMFLHGDFLHIVFNSLYLWVFGDNIEDYLGHIGFLAFYLLSGIGAMLIHILFNWSSEMPCIGASGAIAGVLGAYLLLYPSARVVTLVPIIFILRIMEIPAIVFLGFWIIMQFVSLSGAQEGVAWWAHIGGFFIGIAMIIAYKTYFGGSGKRPPGRGGGGNGGAGRPSYLTAIDGGRRKSRYIN